ncbi:MAG: transporter [Kiritimatiellae bacterium]|nr:transporter [Kiritimatiellia bacterium]
MRRVVASTLCLLAPFLSHRPAHAVSVKVYAAADYSAGEYGSATVTHMLYVPLTAKVDFRAVAAKLTVPYLQVWNEGGPVTLVGDTPEEVVVVSEEYAAGYEEAGLGDIIGSVSWLAPPLLKGTVFVDVTAKAKLPTADAERGLGTGEADYSAQLDATKVMANLLLLGTLGYKVPGEPPGMALDAAFYGTLGAGYVFHPRLTAGLLTDLRQATLPDGDAPLELTAYLSAKLTGNWSLLTYAVKGFSDASPDYALGIQVSYRRRAD